MKTFARIPNNTTTDVCYGDDVDAATGKSFAAKYIKDNGGVAAWIVVPDGTLPGSTVALDQSGNVIGVKPPPSNKPDPKPIGMSGKEFTTYCGMTLATVGKTSFQGGLERFDAILAAVETSGAKMMTLVRKTFQAAIVPGGKFTYDDAALLFPYIVANGAVGTMTADEATALLAAWQKT